MVKMVMCSKLAVLHATE